MVSYQYAAPSAATNGAVPTQLVVMFEDGGFFCSCDWSARHGLACRHYFAVWARRHEHPGSHVVVHVHHSRAPHAALLAAARASRRPRSLPSVPIAGGRRTCTSCYGNTSTSQHRLSSSSSSSNIGRIRRHSSTRCSMPAGQRRPRRWWWARKRPMQTRAATIRLKSLPSAGAGQAQTHAATSAGAAAASAAAASAGGAATAAPGAASRQATVQDGGDGRASARRRQDMSGDDMTRELTKRRRPVARVSFHCR